MTTGEIIDKLRSTMKKSPLAGTNWDAVTETSSIEALGFDSLSILDLVYDIQQEFGIEFDAESLIGVKTVGELAAFLQKQGA